MALLVAMLFSTSLGVAVELAVYILFAASAELRLRFLNAMRHPAAIALGLFMLIVFIGMIHGTASWGARVEALIGWRKVLLFPLALAVFDGPDCKKHFLGTFLIVIVIGTLISTATFLELFKIYRHAPGIVMHNHATQGMVFAVGAAIAIVALMERKRFFRTPPAAHIAFCIVALLLLVGNIAFITPGRSGYLALVVLVSTVVFASLLRTPSRWLSAGLLVGVAVTLLASSQVRERIERGVYEIADADRAPKMSPLGIRVMMWRNARDIIAKYPVFGVGTGSFESAYRAQLQNADDWRNTPTNDPHNQFLKIWAEQGVFGLLVLLVFIYAVLHAKGSAPYRQLAVGVLLAWCGTSLFSSHFSTFVEGRFLFFWLGAMLAGNRFGRTSIVRD